MQHASKNARGRMMKSTETSCWGGTVEAEVKYSVVGARRGGLVSRNGAGWGRGARSIAVVACYA